MKTREKKSNKYIEKENIKIEKNIEYQKIQNNMLKTQVKAKTFINNQYE